MADILSEMLIAWQTGMAKGEMKGKIEVSGIDLLRTFIMEIN